MLVAIERFVIVQMIDIFSVTPDGLPAEVSAQIVEEEMGSGKG